MRNNTGQTTQTVDNLQAEIEFREKLSRQHVSGEVLLPDYYTKKVHDQILLERVDATYKQMKDLTEHGIDLSPFLELGAERGQRSLVLANDFGANGVAIDVSYHQLRTMEYFSKLFQREKLPARICCDVNHLPFKNNSFAFVFGYEFLHHFPSLKPIVKEIYRVLSNGYFYFDEEPFKRILKIVLYKQKNRMYSEYARRKNRYIKLIESFVSEPSRDEVEHGIIENNDLTLAEWSDALSIFDERNVDLFSINNLTSKLHDRLRLSNLPNFLLGGIIAGLCRKKARVDSASQIDISGISDLLACPDCMTPSSNGSFDRPSLIQLSNGFKCSQCGFIYPCREGIIFLLPRGELQQLYPEF